MSWVWRGCAAAAVMAISCAVQPQFDVAAIRPSSTARAGGEGSGWERITVSSTGVPVLNAGLSYCIRWAYNLKLHQVSGPDWAETGRYDILAKTAQPVSTDQLKLMMQALLAERFQLKLHREQRTQSVFVLVVRKNGPKLRDSQTGGSAQIRVAGGDFVFQHVTMPDFADLLGHLAGIDRLVLDRTGIHGVYDITLPAAARTTREDPSSIFGAVEEAGFELQPRKESVELLFIDHAERPSAN
jgi:uncharacterized protein (TIGR03435 family)